MKVVDKTEKGKYYIAYWSTPVTKIVCAFKQELEPISLSERLPDEHIGYWRLNSWLGYEDHWVEEPIMNTLVSSFSFENLEFKAVLFELNDDEIAHHIVMEII